MEFVVWQSVAGLLIIVALMATSLVKRYLSASGALAGALIGSGILLSGGLGWLGLLAAFMLLGSILTRLGNNVKKLRSEMSADRGLKNVLANGLPLLAFALAYAASRSPIWAVAYAVGVGAATSDTISTEVGMLSRASPRRITRPWEAVKRGASGGITALGLAAGALAALAISLLASAFWVVGIALIPLVALMGLFGDVVDSLLGDTLEIKHECADGSVADDPRSCGSVVRSSGYWFMNNHTVNLSSIAISGLLAALAMYIH